MDVKYNINNYVKVKLTQYGIDILKQNHCELNNKFPNVYGKFNLQLTEEGYYKTQMYDLMYIFGKYLIIGCQMPFKSDIILCKVEEL